jgi:hypothetical protein
MLMTIKQIYDFSFESTISFRGTECGIDYNWKSDGCYRWK